MEELVKELTGLGVLKTPHIIKAFLQCDRAEFVPEEFKAEAYTDIPLPLLAGQTISQPYTVAFMMELLAPAAGQKVLDVGFGSGWTTALLAEIVGERGKVYGLEVLPELFELGKANLGKFKLKNVQLLNQSGWDGLATAAPFDRILVSAAAQEIPIALREQLAIGGRMVIPVGNSIWLLEKMDGGKFREREHPGFMFVPLVK